LYSDTLTNVAGCDSILSIQLSILQADTSVIQSGFTLTSQASGATYQWLNCDTGMPIPGATSSSFTATVNGNYALIITENGCVDTSRCYSIMGVSIDDFQHGQLDIYPNPTSDIIFVSYPDGITQVALFDVLGREVWKKQLAIGQQRVEIDLGAYRNGSYLLEVTVKDRIIIQKIVIQ